MFPSFFSNFLCTKKIILLPEQSTNKVFWTGHFSLCYIFTAMQRNSLIWATWNRKDDACKSCCHRSWRKFYQYLNVKHCIQSMELCICVSVVRFTLPSSCKVYFMWNSCSGLEKAKNMSKQYLLLQARYLRVWSLLMRYLKIFLSCLGNK